MSKFAVTSVWSGGDLSRSRGPLYLVLLNPVRMSDSLCPPAITITNHHHHHLVVIPEQKKKNWSISEQLEW